MARRGLVFVYIIISCVTLLAFSSTRMVLAKPRPLYTHADWPSEYSEYEINDIVPWSERTRNARTFPETSSQDWNSYDYGSDTTTDWGRGVDKRSPACIRKCVEQGALHPIQCHSLC